MERNNLKLRKDLEMGEYYIRLHTSPVPKAFRFDEYTEKGPRYTRQELGQLQAYWAINGYQSRPEWEQMRVNKLFTYRSDDNEAILQQRLKPCTLSLPPMKQAAALRRRSLGGCFEGQAQHPSTWTLDDVDTDTAEARETRYWQQRYAIPSDCSTITPPPNDAGPASPDLFCDEVFDDPPPPYSETKQRYIFGDNASDEEISTPPSPVIVPCAQLVVFGKELHTGDSEDPVELSDDDDEHQPPAAKKPKTSNEDEGVVVSMSEEMFDEEGDDIVMVVAKHEEMLKRRKLTRAEHLAVDTMTKLCEAEGYSIRTHTERLKLCKQRLYTRKRDYHKAVEACVKLEEELDRKREDKRLAKEAYAACIDEERAIRMEREVADIVILDSDEEREQREELFREQR